ncbi:MAG: GGDEF and EAL domain-containing protein [Pseudomonadota bacterium]
MYLIFLIAIMNAMFNWSVSKSYHKVTSDFEKITLLSAQATDSVNKIHRLLSLSLEDRARYAESVRLSLSLMDKSHQELMAAAKVEPFEHLSSMTDPQIRGSEVLERVVSLGRQLVDSALLEEGKPADVFRFSTLATSQFGRVLNTLTTDTAEEQETLSRRSLIATFFLSSVLTLLVVGTILLIFIPMENRIILTNKELEEEKLKAVVAKKATEFQAKHDPLTGLANRRVLTDALESIATNETSAENVILIRIDLDRFKAVNDTFGHDAGDHILKVVGTILTEEMRDGDLVARVGGDEFIILLKDGCTSEFGRCVCERLLGRIVESHDYHGKTLNVGASFGIASTENEMVNMKNIIVCADAALYEAKKRGRCRIVAYDLKLHAEEVFRRDIAREMLSAIERSEFEPYFQPQLNAVTGELVGVEVLARWSTKTYGVLLPDDFLPVAHELSEVERIDEIIFQKAMNCFGRLKAMGIFVPKASFNVTARRIRNLAEGNLIPLIPQNGPRIAFEVLESVFVEEQNNDFANAVHRLRKNGITIEIDDFGSDHASIVGLTNLKPDLIKIDQRLVLPAIDVKEFRAFMQNIVKMARVLEIKVVAEGIETELHADLAITLGCDYLQGFYFSGPLDFNSFKSYCRSFRRFSSEKGKYTKTDDPVLSA